MLVGQAVATAPLVCSNPTSVLCAAALIPFSAACHAVQDLFQSAALSIESGAVLARCLAGASSLDHNELQSGSDAAHTTHSDACID